MVIDLHSTTTIMSFSDLERGVNRNTTSLLAPGSTAAGYQRRSILIQCRNANRSGPRLQCFNAPHLAPDLQDQQQRDGHIKAGQLARHTERHACHPKEAVRPACSSFYRYASLTSLYSANLTEVTRDVVKNSTEDVKTLAQHDLNNVRSKVHVS